MTTKEDVCERDTPCKNGATCMNTFEQPGYACRCVEQWQGVTCEQMVEDDADEESE